MPYKYIELEPEVAYFNKDLTIYNTYSDGDWEMKYEYWFTLDAESADNENAYEFDIRNFEIYDDYLTIEENFDILTLREYIIPNGYRYSQEDEYLYIKKVD